MKQHKYLALSKDYIRYEIAYRESDSLRRKRKIKEVSIELSEIKMQAKERIK
jgi:hypothetical protein